MITEHTAMVLWVLFLLKTGVKESSNKIINIANYIKLLQCVIMDKTSVVFLKSFSKSYSCHIFTFDSLKVNNLLLLLMKSFRKSVD